MRIQGVYPPIATPFDAQGRLNREALVANIKRWNATGLSGYVVAGSNGESALLETEEITEAVRIVREAALPDQLVIAGTGCPSTQATIRLTRLCAQAGAQAALVITPFFYPKEMTDAALSRYFRDVADASPIPVLVYNVPKFTHLNLAPATVAAVAPHPNIVGIKDSAGDVNQIAALKQLCPPDFDVLVGHAGAFFGGLEVGASGGILALANVAARGCVTIYELMRAGRRDEAQALHKRLLSVANAVTSDFGVPGLKAALDLVGWYGGMPRPPLLPVDEPTRQEIRRRLVEAELISP